MSEEQDLYQQSLDEFFSKVSDEDLIGLRGALENNFLTVVDNGKVIKEPHPNAAKLQYELLGIVRKVTQELRKNLNPPSLDSTGLCLIDNGSLLRGAVTEQIERRKINE